jgi:hypothetical protein
MAYVPLYISWRYITDKLVFHQAEHVFEQLGPLALQVGAHLAEGRGTPATVAPSPAPRPKLARAHTIG